MKFIWSKFAKTKNIQKLAAQKTPMRKEFTPEGFKLRLERARKIARITEEKSHIGLTKKVESAFIKTISKQSKSNQLPKLVKQKTRALKSAFRLSLKRGTKAGEKSASRLGLSKSAFKSGAKDRPANLYKKNYGLTDEESRALGFPPREPMSAAKKYALAKSKKFEPINKPFYIINPSTRKVKQIDRFSAQKGTYFRPSTQRYELIKKRKKRK